MSAAVVDGSDHVTGHIISTTIGGKNGEPKQVWVSSFNLLCDFCSRLIFFFVLSSVYIIWKVNMIVNQLWIPTVTLK